MDIKSFKHFSLKVADLLKQARVQSQEAAKIAKEARDGNRERKEAATATRTKSKELLRRAEDLGKGQVEAAQTKAETLAQRNEQLAPKLAQLKSDLATVQAAKGEAMAQQEVDSIRDKADQAQQRLVPLNDSFERMGQQLAEVDSRVKQLMDSSGGMAAEAGTAKDQIQQVQCNCGYQKINVFQVENALPGLKEDWEEARHRMEQTAAQVKESRAKLALLKEKVLLARDKANRVKLGAHFERGSFLELPLPQPADDFAALTDVRFFFRTRDSNGMVIFHQNPQTLLFRASPLPGRRHCPIGGRIYGH